MDESDADGEADGEDMLAEARAQRQQSHAQVRLDCYILSRLSVKLSQGRDGSCNTKLGQTGVTDIYQGHHAFGCLLTEWHS